MSEKGFFEWFFSGFGQATRKDVTKKGGRGSGNWRHGGIPGHQGGSAPGGGGGGAQESYIGTQPQRQWMRNVAKPAAPAAGGPVAWSTRTEGSGGIHATSGDKETIIVPSPAFGNRVYIKKNGQNVASQNFRNQDNAKTYGEYYLKTGHELPPMVATKTFVFDHYSPMKGASPHAGPWRHSVDDRWFVSPEGNGYRSFTPFGSMFHKNRDEALTNTAQNYSKYRREQGED